MPKHLRQHPYNYLFFFIEKQIRNPTQKQHFEFLVIFIHCECIPIIGKNITNMTIYGVSSSEKLELVKYQENKLNKMDNVLSEGPNV